VADDFDRAVAELDIEIPDLLKALG